MPTDGDASSNGPTLATSGTSDATDVNASAPGNIYLHVLDKIWERQYAHLASSSVS